MERRLKVAAQLLNPENSVLIVTIDEKEYLRLGILLEQTFPEASIQMISSVINPKGSSRTGRFSRVDEYIYFVFFGSASVSPSVAGARDLPLPTVSSRMVWFSLGLQVDTEINRNGAVNRSGEYRPGENTSGPLGAGAG